MVVISTEKLQSKIKEKCGTHVAFANASGINEATLSRLLTRGNWRASQIKAAIEVLDIPASEIPDYFFDDGLAKTQEVVS